MQWIEQGEVMKYTGLFLMVALCAVNGSVSAQGGAQSSKPWEKYSERIKASEAVAPLGEDLFGDRVSLSNGALSFAGPHLNLETQVNGKKVGTDPHTPIKPETIRRGEHD